MRHAAALQPDFPPGIQLPSEGQRGLCRIF